MTQVYHDIQQPSTKVCLGCLTEKPLCDFSPSQLGKYGFNAQCKDCVAANMRERRAHPRALHQPSLFTLSKWCSGCKATKSWEAFSKNTSASSGLNELCRDCDKVKHQARRVRSIPASITYKTCTECETEKSIECFTIGKGTSDGYNHWCKSCVSTYNLEYRTIHQVEKRERDLAYYQANRERILIRQQAYYVAHEEQNQAYNRAYRKAYPVKHLEYGRRHEARKANATIEDVSYERILERDAGICHICNQAIDPKTKDSKARLSFDHVIPLARGGAHSEENIKLAHKGCNSRKSTRLLEDMTPFQRRGVH